ncbi:MAG: GNAT family N-acetyltransferase, partial [Clostridia bacterium]|nr:GNAT family N-acetyltransferase [Clostridia bacterium]
MGELYFGRGNASQRDDYLDFINLVFGFNGNERDFMKLLPNLYKEEYDPCYNNFIATEDGKFRAAIGVYPRTFSVMGEVLLSHGIGNVAVHPYHRSKGYMKKLMNMALDDMVEAGADFSDLGGLRQRYQYFGFDNAGCNRVFHISETAIRHCFAGSDEPKVYFKQIFEGDPMLDDVFALYEQKIVHTCRKREHLYDTMKEVYVILDKANNTFRGFCGGGLSGLTLISADDFYDTIRAYISVHGGVDVVLPPYETELIALAHRICGSCHINSAVKIAVFRFRRMLSAYLKLKAATEGLVDGVRQYTVEGIRGVGGTTVSESFCIAVKDGAVTLADV